MNFHLPTDRSPLWTRITAGLAVSLILALVICSASPVAHAWLHAGDAGVAADHHAAGQPQHSPQGDDNCVVVMFASGVLVALVLVLLARTLRPRAGFSLSFVAAYCRATPRYWLPPLCGPPRN